MGGHGATDPLLDAPPVGLQDGGAAGWQAVRPTLPAVRGGRHRARGRRLARAASPEHKDTRHVRLDPKISLAIGQTLL